MPATLAPHPAPDRLAAFLRGDLPPDEHAEIETHVTGCDDCCATLRGFPAGSLDQLARAAAGDITHETAAGPPELSGHPRYRVLRQLGAGGMGVVYLAEHTVMGRTVALKVMSRKYTANAGAVERFRREVRAAAKLSHPNIVTAHDADEAGGLHFLVMEHVEGVSLDRIVARRGPQPVHGACHVIRQAALGLQHAHEKGMVHRDVKPHNLMVTRKGQVKILDFGLARVAEEAAEGAPAAGVTTEGVVMGTPDYLAPEQARDSRGVDARTDVYALGCTLYFLLAGKPPFAAAKTAFEKMVAHTADVPPPLSGVRPDVPAELEAVLAKMTAKRPDDRYPTAAAAAAALEPFTKPGSVLDAEAASSPAVAAFDVEPVAGPTEPGAGGSTDPLPVKRVARGRRKRAGTASGRKRPRWLAWVTVGGAAAVVLLVLAALSVKPPKTTGTFGTGPGAGPPKGGSPHGFLPDPVPATKPRPRVLVVVPSRGLFYPDYGPVKDHLVAAGAEVVTASTQPGPCRFAEGGGGPEVRPDRLVTESQAADFDAVVFTGKDTAEYTALRISPGFSAARRLIDEMRGKKVVAAICVGVRVLMEHEAVRDRDVADCPYIPERRFYAKHGARPVSQKVVTTRDKIVTAATADDAAAFADAVLKAAGK